MRPARTAWITATLVAVLGLLAATAFAQPRVELRLGVAGVPVADDSDSGFAWQAMAGASFAVSESFDLFAQYTYRDSFDRAEIPLDLLPATLGVESTQSIVTVGARFKLGS